MTIVNTITPTFNYLENTVIRNAYFGWMGETKLKLNGKNWLITTTKGHKGTISTHCKVVQDEGNGCYSFMVFGDNDPKEDFYLNESEKGVKATEKAIKQIHFKSLADFDAMNESEVLPDIKKDYKIEIGQVLFTDGCGDENPRAVYEISGNKYKTVLLDGSQTRIDDYVKNYKNKFGIGVYYKEDDVISQQEVDDLLITAHETMKIQAEINRVKSIEESKVNAERAAYLSKFIKADRRTTTAIIKKHILKTWPNVKKVEVKTDVFSGGDSMDVTYYASEEIKELDSFIRSFQEGHFNGMDDIYEYTSDRAPIIIDGHILQTYKYVHDHFTKVDLIVNEIPETEPLNTDTIQVIDYSQYSIAVIGEKTRQIKDQLFSLGGKFDRHLKCGAGFIFSKKKLTEVTALLQTLSLN